MLLAYKVELLKREFPFLDMASDVLSEYRGSAWEVDFVNLDQVKVERGGERVMGWTGIEDSYEWSGGGYCHYTHYVAVCSEEGHFKLEVLASQKEWSEGSGRRGSIPADTIGEQLFSKRLNPQFIVKCEKQDHDANGNGEPWHGWTILKMDGFDQLAHHKAMLDRAAVELKGEMEAACVGGV